MGLQYDRLKLALVSLAYFFIIITYTFVKELKDSIFLSVVGRDYVPTAKIISMIILIPAILFYSYLVDRIRRYQLLCFYALLYGSVGLLCAYLVGHESIGLYNTDASPKRLFGWFFYFFLEGYSPFVVSVFWSFLNSISSPKSAKSDYSIVIAASKMSGVLSAGLAWIFFSWKDLNGHRLYSDVANHQIMLTISSISVLMVVVVIFYLVRTIPGQYLHGYEAVYEFEKERKKEGQQKTGLFSGLKMLMEWPYIMGIFFMQFFYDVVVSVLSYLRLGVAQSGAANMSDVTGELFKQAFMMHFLGLFITLFGTRALVRKFGERTCLLLIPVFSGLLLLYFMIFYSSSALILVYVAIRSVNYAFAQPLRESLYVPTVKEIKFKSKSWIDAFGSKMAKTVGSSFNVIAAATGPAMFTTVYGAFMGTIVACWGLTAYLLGKRYDYAVKHNEVIGAEPEETEESATA